MMQIEVYADVVCPWCYIGDNRLAQALARRPDLAVERHWRPFQLRADQPTAGLPWAEFAREKFGGTASAQAAFTQVTQVGAADGLKFDFSRVASAPNTVDAHRLILWAARQGHEWAMADALFAAYFAEGRDLNRLEDLLAVVGQVGLDTEAATAYLATDTDRAEVMASQQTAAEHGINSVPHYVIDGRYTISGAQPVEVFERVLDYVAGKQAQAR